MRQYPVSVPCEDYRGSDPRKLKKTHEYNRVAAVVQKHLNDEVANWDDDTVGSILSYQVASAIGENSDLVDRIIFRIDGGSNGVTIWKGDYERAMTPSPHVAPKR